MTERINEYLTITVEIKTSKNMFGMKQAFATLFDHNANRVIRTIRGQYVLDGTRAEEFADEIINTDWNELIDRYTILAKATETASLVERGIIEQWLKNDPQFNDAKWHGDDRK